ncbi:MAG: hypothetical protein IKE24_11495 [Clostridia bacterium]|nr:hypothetical protein [Clostridia bacterium]
MKQGFVAALKGAMKRILEFIADKPCGPAAYCWLSYEPENEAAKACLFCL